MLLAPVCSNIGFIECKFIGDWKNQLFVVAIVHLPQLYDHEDCLYIIEFRRLRWAGTRDIMPSESSMSNRHVRRHLVIDMMLCHVK